MDGTRARRRCIVKTYTLAAPAYGKEPGDEIRLHPDDPLVRLNVESGVLLEEATKAVPEQRMTCPLCVEQDKTRPQKASSREELEQHYADKHPAFAAPAWSADNSDGRE
jgi:hypothetical protein